jgi:hypothetical protein
MAFDLLHGKFVISFSDIASQHFEKRDVASMGLLMLGRSSREDYQATGGEPLGISRESL